MAKIIISYRRADSDAIAGRIRDRLADRYGDDAVFMDIEDIPFGIDFREHIMQEFADSDVLLAVVGPEWLGPREGALPRIADESDPVRVEVETALRRPMPIIPVLVHDATMPTADALPDSLKGFAFYNAAEVDAGRDFHPHVDRLIQSMDRVLGHDARWSARRIWLWGAAAAACAVLIAGGAWFYLAGVGSSRQVVASAPPPPVPEVAIVQTPEISPQPPAPPQSGRPVSGPHMQPWQVHHRTAAADFPGLFERLRKDGYRLRTIAPYVANDAEQYASVWVKDGGFDWQGRYGLTAGDLQRSFDDLDKQGYRATWISAHEIGGQVRYAAIYEKRQGPRWRPRFGITSAQLRGIIDDSAKDGFRPVHLYGYPAGGVANFAVLFEKGDDAAPPITFDLIPSDFQKFLEEQTRQGFRPKMISSYRVGEQEYRAGIWEKSSGTTWHARISAPIPSYLAYYDNMVYRGFRPLFLSTFAFGTTVRATSAWENLAFPAEANLIGSRMQYYVRTHQVPGAAIAIAKDGRLVYAAGFGLAERGTSIDATPTTLFRIAGVSKAITAVAVLKLVEAKKLAFDDKVFGPGSLLGERYSTPQFNRGIEQITVRHLLQHSSGFGSTPNDPIAAHAHLAPDEMVRAVINDPARALARAPGTQFEQSDFGYVVLGRVIEQASGKSYEQYVKADVLAPAGIRAMSIGGDTVAAKKPREATYYPDAAYGLKLANIDAAAGWVASPIELVRFLVHVDGAPTKPDVISAASYKLMSTSSGVKAANDADPRYGLGWHTDPQSHAGAMPGSLAYIAVLLDGFAVAAVANTRPGSDEGGQSLQSTLRDIISVVKAWPSYDLFDGRLDRPIVAAR